MATTEPPGHAGGNDRGGSRCTRRSEAVRERTGLMLRLTSPVML